MNQTFSLPTNETVYPISAMGFLQELDQNTGIGPMFIANEKDVFFFRTNQPRAQWTQGQFGGLLLANTGIAGNRAFVNANSDLIFVSANGNVHSFSTARNEMQHWGNVPISREVNNWIRWHDRSLMQFTVVGYHENRVFISVNPYRVQAVNRAGQAITDYAFGGFVVLEIEAMATLLQEATPVWTGLWTGINPMEIVSVGGRCFAMSKDGIGGTGINRLYELREEERYDMVGGARRQVRAIVDTKLYNFQQEFTQKREKSVLLHVHDLAGDVSVNLQRRPTHSTRWLHWGTFSHKAPTRTEQMPSPEFLEGFAQHQLKHIIFGDPVEDDCSPLTDEYYNTARAVQLRLILEAEHFSLENIKIEAQIVPHEDRPVCDEDVRDLPLPAEREIEWDIPETKLCGS